MRPFSYIFASVLPRFQTGNDFNHPQGYLLNFPASAGLFFSGPVFIIAKNLLCSIFPPRIKTGAG